MNVNISVPKQYHDLLVQIKNDTGKTFSETIRCALDLYRKEHVLNKQQQSNRP